MSTRNLGFRILGFHHWVQWRGAKTVSKECSRGPCHGLIPSLWDFAQKYSLQIERRDENWRAALYSLDSEKAIEPCISLTGCLSWSTFDWDRLGSCTCCPGKDIHRSLQRYGTSWIRLLLLNTTRYRAQCWCTDLFWWFGPTKLCGERQRFFRTASLFSTKASFAGLPRQTFPGKPSQDSPKASPRADCAGRKGECKTYCRCTATYINNRPTY